jgi:coenzyme F420-0:L-glutamate ligase/NADPH-dependent F420 reductase
VRAVAVIGGTGALGSALALRLAADGLEVWIGSRDPEKARTSAAALRSSPVMGAIHGAGLIEAAAAADIVFLAVPYAAHAVTLNEIRDAVQGKIVVDATVPLRPPKVGTVQLPAAGSAAVETAAVFGVGVRVVSALQNIGAEKLRAGGLIDSDVLVAGDDAEAVGVVCELLGRLGLKSWHIGPLANSAASEALTSALIQINRRYKLDQSGLRITGKRKEPRDPPQRSLSVSAVPGLPMFEAGDDLAGAIGDRLSASLVDGDVVVIAQKVVSKVEGRAIALATVRPSPESLEIAKRTGKEPAVVELIRSESKDLMRVTSGLIIARHRSGQVLANAGIDASNIADGGVVQVLLWPRDPDASARDLRIALEARFGVKIAVIVSDSIGRAWREGTTGTAIGCSGLRPLRDRRGEPDLFGRSLRATIVGVADEIAAAASLVIGEGAEGLPVAVVSGATYDRDEEAGIGAVIRPLEKDLFL